MFVSCVQSVTCVSVAMRGHAADTRWTCRDGTSWSMMKKLGEIRSFAVLLYMLNIFVRHAYGLRRR